MPMNVIFVSGAVPIYRDQSLVGFKLPIKNESNFFDRTGLMILETERRVGVARCFRTWFYRISKINPNMMPRTLH